MIDGRMPRAIATKIAAFGLPAAHGPLEFPPLMWRSLLAAISVENLTGLATAAASAGTFVVDQKQRDDLREAHLGATTWTLDLERILCRFAESALKDDIDMVVLKGPALAHGFYPDASWRPFKDIDVLVHANDFRRACAVLERMGFRRTLPEPRHGFDERFGKAAEYVNERGLRVDLHRTLVLGAFGIWLDPETLFSRTTSFDFAGTNMRRLDDTTILLHACMHASLGWSPPLLQPLRDLVQVASLGAIDWDRFAVEAERFRLRAVVRHSFGAALDSLGADLPLAAAAVVRSFRETPKERRALSAYTTSKRARGGTLRSTFWAVDGLRGKALLLRDLILPDRSFLAARTAAGVRPSYLRRLATPFRWLRRRPE